MGFAGTIEEFPLADVFQRIQKNQESGTLLVEDGRRSFLVTFEEGKVRWLKPAPEGEEDPFLAGVLRRRGLPELPPRGSEGPRSRISAAVKAGALPSTAARDLFEVYCAERALDLLSLEKGRLRFEEGRRPPDLLDPDQKAFGIRLDPGTLLFDWSRRTEEWKTIRKLILSDEEVFGPDRGREGSGGLDEEQQATLDLLDGKRTVGEVAALCASSRFGVHRALAALLEKRLIKPLSPDDATSASRRLLAAGRYDEAIQVGRKGLETERNNPELRRVLAETLAKKGEKEKAAKELKLLAKSYLDEGNSTSAEKAYRQAVDLDPKDFEARERLFDIVAEHRSFGEALKEGQAYASAVRKYGTADGARDLLGRLADLAPADPPVLEALAQIYDRVGNREEAVKLLRRAARIHLDAQRYGQAQAIFERILFLWPGDAESEQRVGEIKHRGERRRAHRHRVAARVGVVAGVVALVLSWLVYDWISHLDFVRETTRLIALASESRYAEGAEALRAFEKAHPLTIASWQARSLRHECRVLDLLKRGRTLERRRNWVEAMKTFKDAVALAADKLDADSPAAEQARAAVARVEAKMSGKGVEEEDPEF